MHLRSMTDADDFGAYDYVVVPLNTGSLTMVSDQGERSQAGLRAGEPYYRDAGVVDMGCEQTHVVSRPWPSPPSCAG